MGHKRGHHRVCKYPRSLAGIVLLTKLDLFSSIFLRLSLISYNFLFTRWRHSKWRIKSHVISRYSCCWYSSSRLRLGRSLISGIWKIVCRRKVTSSTETLWSEWWWTLALIEVFVQLENPARSNGCTDTSNFFKIQSNLCLHDDVIKWKHFPRYWPFVRGIHRSPVNSPHKGQWRGALMFSLICAWITDWVNNREAGDLRCHRAHYDVIVMFSENLSFSSCTWYCVVGSVIRVFHFVALTLNIYSVL